MVLMARTRLHGLAGFLLLSGMAANLKSAESAESPAEALLRSGRPLVIAHRGYSAVAPENTLPSFQLAKAAAPDLIELDYHHARDGVPVVIHDETLDRTTDAVAKWGGSKIRVDSRTAGELQTLDAGKWFDPRFAGTRLPTLREAVAFIQKDHVTLIERKAGDPTTLVKLLREHGWVNQLVVQSFDWEFLTGLHQLEPKQVLGALGPPSKRDGRRLTDAEKALSVEWIDGAVKTGARIVVWNRQVSGETVVAAHARGLKVWVYTINEPALAEQLLELGVDGIITDNPALMWRTLALRGWKQQAAR
ncbi:MAG: glycerophosphodiester phosphodiesterase family protein [Verrucomicrobiae bacterium]|nr:glycerophosphodiester phosphodiesterase family protein [Verrucomicrobiae bacterium]